MKTKTTHTPGPWGFMDDPVEGIWVESSFGDFCIAEIPKQTAGLDHDASPREANARLIAAAPEHKKVTEAVLQAMKAGYIEAESMLGRLANAAINKEEVS